MSGDAEGHHTSVSTTTPRNTRITSRTIVTTLPTGRSPRAPCFWDNYKDYTYVGTLDGLYQHTLIATVTRLRGSHFRHQTCPKCKGLRPFKTVLLVILGLLKFVQNSFIKPFKTCYYCPMTISPVPLGIRELDIGKKKKRKTYVFPKQLVCKGSS